MLSMLLLFLAGVAVGALGMYVYASQDGRSDGRFRHSTGPQQHVFLERLADRLQLTPEQRQQIAEIHTESRQRSEALRHELRPQLEHQMTETRERILAVLTPEQRTELEALREEFGHRMDRFFLGEGGRHHRPERSTDGSGR